MNWDSSSGGGGGAARHGFRRRQQGIPDKPNQVSREVLSSTDDGPQAPPHKINAPFSTDYANQQLGDLNPDYDHHRRERKMKEEETMSMNSGLFAGLGMTKQPNGRRGQQQSPSSPMQQQQLRRPEEVSNANITASTTAVDSRFQHHQPHSPPPNQVNNNNEGGGGGFRSQLEKRKNQEVAGKITGARAWTEQSSAAAYGHDSDQLRFQQQQLSAYGGYDGGTTAHSNNIASPQYSTDSPHNSTTPSRTPYPPLNQSSDYISPAHQNYSKTAPGGGSGGNGYSGGGGGDSNYGVSSPPSNISEPQRTRTPEPLPRGYHGNDRAQQALDQQSNYHPAFGGNGGNMGGYSGHSSYGGGGGAQSSNGTARNLQPIDQSPKPPPLQKVLVPVVTIGPNCPVELVNQVHGNFNESQKTYLPTVVYTTSTYTSHQ